MSNDRYIIKESTLKAIGDSLRTKTKTTKKLKPDEFQPLLETLYSDSTATSAHIRYNKRACTATGRKIYKGYQNGQYIYEYKSGEDKGTMQDYAGAQIGGTLLPGSGQASSNELGSEGLEIENGVLLSDGTCTDVKVVVPEGVTTIAKSAFSYNRTVEEVVLPTTITRIESKAFYECSRLRKINLPENLVFLGDNTFYRCLSLLDVILPPKIKTLNNGVFNGCLLLKQVILPDGLENLDLSAFTFDNASDFYINSTLSALETLYIPASVKDIGTFSEDVKVNSAVCGYIGTGIMVDPLNQTYESYEGTNAVIERSTKTLVVGCKNTIIPTNVTSIGAYAFANCTCLESINIPNTVTSIGEGAFYGCSSLENIIIPNSVTAIDSCTFKGCTLLETISLHNNITSIGYGAFSNCESLVKFRIPNKVTDLPYDLFSGCTSLTCVGIPKAVKIIGSYAFNVVSHAVPVIQYVNYEGTESDWNAINISSTGNYHLTAATIRFNNTSDSYPTGTLDIQDGVLKGLGTWYGNELRIPDTVTTLDYDCLGRSLTTTEYITPVRRLYIPASVTSITTTGIIPSYSQNLLKTIVIDENNQIYDSRNNCNAIIRTANNELILGSRTTIIPEGILELGQGAFADMPATITNPACNGTNGIFIMPSSITRFFNLGFNDNDAVKLLVLPDNLKRLGTQMLRDMPNLLAVWIPKTLTSIYTLGFYPGNNACIIFYEGSEEEWDAIEINDSNGYPNMNDAMYSVTKYFNVSKSAAIEHMQCGLDLNKNYIYEYVIKVKPNKNVTIKAAGTYCDRDIILETDTDNVTDVTVWDGTFTGNGESD